MNLYLCKKIPSPNGQPAKGLPTIFLLIGLIPLFPFTSGLAADQEAQHIIQMVDGQYGQIKTIEGIINKNIQGGGNTQSIRGRFLIKRPDKSYVEFANPHQIVCSNDSICWVEKVAENVVLKFHIAKMNKFEREALGVQGLIGLNVFDQLRDGFDLHLSDTLDGDLVVLAQPKSKGKFISKILVKVDPKRWIILAYEIFDLTGKLVSQTKYEDYSLYGENLLFPNRVSTRSIYQGEIVKETDNFSRLRLNQPISDDNFEFIPPKKAKIITPEG